MRVVSDGRHGVGGASAGILEPTFGREALQDPPSAPMIRIGADGRIGGPSLDVSDVHMCRMSTWTCRPRPSFEVGFGPTRLGCEGGGSHLQGNFPGFDRNGVRFGPRGRKGKLPSPPPEILGGTWGREGRMERDCQKQRGSTRLVALQNRINAHERGRNRTSDTTSAIHKRHVGGMPGWPIAEIERPRTATKQESGG